MCCTRLCFLASAMFNITCKMTMQYNQYANVFHSSLVASSLSGKAGLIGILSLLQCLGLEVPGREISSFLRCYRYLHCTQIVERCDQCCTLEAPKFGWEHHGTSRSASESMACVACTSCSNQVKIANMTQHDPAWPQHGPSSLHLHGASDHAPQAWRPQPAALGSLLLPLRLGLDEAWTGRRWPIGWTDHWESGRRIIRWVSEKSHASTFLMYSYDIL